MSISKLLKIWSYHVNNVIDKLNVLFVCSTCGLAEELEQESKAAQKASVPKSACGSVSTSNKVIEIVDIYDFHVIVSGCVVEIMTRVFYFLLSVIWEMPSDVPAAHI